MSTPAPTTPSSDDAPASISSTGTARTKILSLVSQNGDDEPIGFALLMSPYKAKLLDLEASFWSPVTAYDYEEEQNELKRYVNIIKASYLPDIEKQFVELIKR